MKYTLKIWYAASPDDEPQVHKGLEHDQAVIGVSSFLKDLLALEGDGVRKLSIEKELDDVGQARVEGAADVQKAFEQVEQAGQSLKTIREAAKRQGVDIR